MQRLQDALVWCGFVMIGTVLLVTDSLPIRLTGTAQQVAYIVVFVGAVVFLAAGYVLIVAKMRRKPATSRLWTWGTRLLVAGFFGLSILVLYGFTTDLVPGWHRSSTELLVATVLGALLFVLLSLALVLVVVAIIADFRQLSRHRRPPANSNA